MLAVALRSTVRGAYVLLYEPQGRLCHIGKAHGSKMFVQMRFSDVMRTSLILLILLLHLLLTKIGENWRLGRVLLHIYNKAESWNRKCYFPCFKLDWVRDCRGGWQGSIPWEISIGRRCACLGKHIVASPGCTEIQKLDKKVQMGCSCSLGVRGELGYSWPIWVTSMLADTPRHVWATLLYL